MGVVIAIPSTPCLPSLLDTGPKVTQGDALSPFVATDLQGREVNLASYLGHKVVLLDFWSIYCAPCVAEMPTLIDLHNKYNKMGLEVFGVSLDSHFNARRLAKFVEGFEYRIPYPIIHDAGSQIRQMYGVGTLPTTIIVDASGKVQLIHIGFSKEDKRLIADFVIRLMEEQTRRTSQVRPSK